MKDGKLIGDESSGNGVVKLASGPFATLNGKAIKFSSGPISPIRWMLELTAE